MKGHRWYAATYDFLTQGTEAKVLRPLRRRVLGVVSGLVLEIGAGTGANIPYYHDGQTVVAIEPDPFMLSRARKRARAEGYPIHLVQSIVEALPFREASFDTIVC